MVCGCDRRRLLARRVPGKMGVTTVYGVAALARRVRFAGQSACLMGASVMHWENAVKFQEDSRGQESPTKFEVITFFFKTQSHTPPNANLPHYCATAPRKRTSSHPGTASPRHASVPRKRTPVTPHPLTRRTSSPPPRPVGHDS